MFALEKRRKPAGFAPSCRFVTRPSIRAGAARQSVPVGNLLFGAGFENHIGHTPRGDVPLHPGGFSEAVDVCPWQRAFRQQRWEQLPAINSSY
jgi:hypothetical protein